MHTSRSKRKVFSEELSVFFFFKQKTAYEISACLVGSEMCIGDRYGGVVGYFDLSGDADLAIAIRTASLKDGVASVQAGAGLVADSVPALEYEESRNKAAAAVESVVRASNLVHLP